MDELISVVVPMYNSEKYIADLIKAMKDQIYTNWELLLIDDHSQDLTYQIAKEFENGKIHIVENERKGVSAARNTGIKYSKGKYLAFVDADDKIDNLYLETLRKDATNSKADIVFQGYVEITANQRKKIPFPWIGISDNSKIINTIIPTLIYPVGNEVCPMMPVWRTLIKKSILINNHLKFDEKISMSEDFQLMLQLLPKCNRIYGSNEMHYGYFRNTASAMNTYISNNSNC